MYKDDKKTYRNIFNMPIGKLILYTDGWFSNLSIFLEQIGNSISGYQVEKNTLNDFYKYKYTFILVKNKDTYIDLSKLSLILYSEMEESTIKDLANKDIVSQIKEELLSKNAIY
jgi:hypothetical protein